MVVLLAGCAGTPAENPPPAEVVEAIAPVSVEVISQEDPLLLAPQPRRLTILAVGDLMVHRDQYWDAELPGGGYDFTHNFAQVMDDLNEGFAIGNLETVFGGPEIGPMCFPNFNTPDEFADAIRAGGFDFLTTCNNHSLDWGPDALIRTQNVLDAAGLAYTGTYRNQADSEQITIVEAEGLRIAILAFTFSTNGIPIPQGREYLVNMLTEEKVIADLAKARALEPDLIIVLPHMGNEYEEFTRPAFLHWMDLMLYHGADFVLASHPHVLQPMMTRELVDIDGVERTGFIMPSLGNFISTQRTEPRDISIILKLDVVQEAGERPVLERVRFVPIWVQYRHADGSVHIRVLSVGDAVESFENPENPLGLRPHDIERLHRANSYITNMFLGAAKTGDDFAREYIFFERDEQ
ncbi:MAG: CapA family protein [Oscillospiraceae bacterium]|nr:CapA family protein [Oscillospiraceae bacterium]